MFVTTTPPAPAVAIHAPAPVYPRITNVWTGTAGSGSIYGGLSEDWGEAQMQVDENLAILEERIRRIPR